MGLCSVHYSKHCIYIYIYITEFYILSFFAEQFLVLCRRAVCLAHSSTQKALSSLHYTEMKTRRTKLTHWTHQVPWKEEDPHFFFFFKGRFPLYNRKKNAFIHSLSIYYVSAAVQCSEGGTVRTSVGFLLPWRMRLAALVLTPRLTASFQDGWDCLKSLRCILWLPRTFECYFYSLDSSGNSFGTLSHRTESGVATIF